MLDEIIIGRIKAENGISFHDFMEMALYHPELGYYTSHTDKIGLGGDYYTSCNITELFGALIGRQMEEMWRLLGEQPFTIVEYGAGMGYLCRDLLKYLKDNERMYADLRYCIIEKSPAMRAKEQEHLVEKVTWLDNIAEAGEINGCILSNELLDNFSVHKVVMEKSLMEVYVGYDNGFYEFLKPAPETIKSYLTDLNIVLPVHFCTEVNLEAVRWLRDISSVLKTGYVLTIDYGHPSAELYQKYRSDGTLMCYYKHQVHELPYQHIGEQDITAHVNFSALYFYGIKYGLDYAAFTNQKNFLISLGINKCFAEMAKDSMSDYQKQIGTLHHFLNEMGVKFKVLVLQKDAPLIPLTGLKFPYPLFVLTEGMTSAHLPLRAAG